MGFDGIAPPNWQEWDSKDKQKLLKKLKEKNKTDVYPLTPEDFINALDLEGLTLAPYQIRTIESIFLYPRICIRSPRGAGKTTAAALSIWAFIIKHHSQKHDWKIACTAGSWRQLTRFLWPEVHKWYRRINWDALGISRSEIELLTNEAKTNTGQAFSMAANDPNLLEGVHADHLLVVVDEAKAVPPQMWDALEGALGSGNCTILAISTPSIPAGRFYDIQSGAEGLDDWTTFRITIEQAIEAGRINEGWAEQRKKQYGEESAIYRNYVLGEFASSEDGGLIPLDWIEQAMERYPAQHKTPSMIGLDVAYQGADKSVAALATEEGIIELSEWQGLRETELVGEVLHFARKAMAGYKGLIIRDYTVDAIGIGAGVCERLEEQGMRVTRFVGSERATEDLGYIEFANKRAEGYWKLRNALDPENPGAIYLPPHEGLKGDLVAIRWKPDPQGRVLMEKKDAIKKVLGRSPDYADAVVYAMWGAQTEEVGWADV